MLLSGHSNSRSNAPHMNTNVRQISYCSNCGFVSLDLTLNNTEWCPECKIWVMSPKKINTNSTNLNVIRKYVREMETNLGVK